MPEFPEPDELKLMIFPHSGKWHFGEVPPNAPRGTKVTRHPLSLGYKSREEAMAAAASFPDIPREKIKLTGNVKPVSARKLGIQLTQCEPAKKQTPSVLIRQLHRETAAGKVTLEEFRSRFHHIHERENREKERTGDRCTIRYRVNLTAIHRVVRTFSPACVDIGPLQERTGDRCTIRYRVNLTAIHRVVRTFSPACVDIGPLQADSSCRNRSVGTCSTTPNAAGLPKSLPAKPHGRLPSSHCTLPLPRDIGAANPPFPRLSNASYLSLARPLSDRRQP